MIPNRVPVGVRPFIALLCAAGAAAILASPAAAQTGRGTVGHMRVGDDSGQAIWEQPAPAGEKIFRAPAGIKQFKVWFEYDGSAPKRAVIKLIAPQGVFLDQKDQQLANAGTYSVDFSFDQPLTDQEYLVNAYVDVDGAESLADGFTLLVGDASQITPSHVSQATVAAPPAAGDAIGAPPVAGAGQSPTPAGAPSTLLLVGSGIGVIVLLAIVVWAGMSALKQR